MTTQNLLDWQHIREWAESKPEGSRVGEACTNSKCPLANYLNEQTGHVWTVGPSIHVMGRDIRLDKPSWVQMLIEVVDDLPDKDQAQWITREQFLASLDEVREIQ